MSIESNSSPHNIEEAIAAGIQAATFGGLSGLMVGLADGTVVVRAIAPSYYLKQLALEGAKTSRDQFGRVPIRFEVSVTG